MPQTTDIEPIFEAAEIATRLEALGTEIRKDAGMESEVFLLGILKGTAMFLADLLRAIPGPASYGFIDVIRDPADQVADALEIDFLSFTDIRDRNVYVLKDVVTTGVIENYLLGQLRSRGPAALHLVALLDRPDARTVDVATQFRAFTIGEGTFVGYGLESEGRHGNLPFVGRIAG